MRGFIVSLFAAVLLLQPGAPARAESTGPPPLSLKRVTLSLRSTALDKALKELFAGSGEVYDVAKEARQLPVTLELTDELFDTALVRLMEAARRENPNLTAYRNLTNNSTGLFGGKELRTWRTRSYRVQLREPRLRGSELPGLEQRVAVVMRDTPLRQALERLLSESSHTNRIPNERLAFPRVSVDPGIPDIPITLKVEGVVVDTALEVLAAAVAEQVPEAVLCPDEKNDGDYVLRRPGNPTELEILQTWRHEVSGKLENRVSLDAKEISLRSAIATIMPNNVSVLRTFRVEREVPDVPLAIRLQDVPVEKALAEILAAASRNGPRITYTRAGQYFAVHIAR